MVLFCSLFVVVGAAVGVCWCLLVYLLPFDVVGCLFERCCCLFFVVVAVCGRCASLVAVVACCCVCCWY